MSSRKFMSNVLIMSQSQQPSGAVDSAVVVRFAVILREALKRTENEPKCSAQSYKVGSAASLTAQDYGRLCRLNCVKWAVGKAKSDWRCLPPMKRNDQRPTRGPRFVTMIESTLQNLFSKSGGRGGIHGVA